MRNFYVCMLTLAFVSTIATSQAYAEVTTPNQTVLNQIQALMAQIQELQKQIATIRGELQTVLKDNLTEGTSSDDVKKIQQILATDANIYPEGKVTGYFGPLTKEAIKRFQSRHELEVTGVIDEATHDLLEEYLKETTNGTIPPGLLRAPGIEKKVEMRFKEGCDKESKGKADFCRKIKVKYENGELEIEDESESNHSDVDDDEDKADDNEDTNDDENEADDEGDDHDD